jgi:fatty-acid desaturase
MKNSDQQVRLQRFWGEAIFSLGTLWGLANCVYFPIAALTSIVGSSWLEVFIILAGGVLTFTVSILAFYHRRIAARLLLAGGIFLFAFAIGGQLILPLSTRGIPNLLLLFLSGAMAIFLGVFGEITDRRGWPSLRDLH